jgi:chromosome segregation ATPase
MVQKVAELEARASDAAEGQRFTHAALLDKIQALECAADEREEKLKSWQAKVRAAKTEDNDAIQRLTEDRESHAAKLSKAMEEMVEFARATEASAQTIAELRAQVDALETRNTNFTLQLADRDSAVEKYEIAVQSCEAQLSRRRRADCVGGLRWTGAIAFPRVP